MAKRVRGSNRPTSRRAPRADRATPPARPAGDDPVVRPRPSAALTAEEEARAAEIEARIVAEERAAEDAERRRRNRARGVESGRSAEPLAVRAASEYAYVRRDVVRIVRIGGFLLAVLAALYILINVTGTIAV
jgi:hypothetical protein